MTLDEIKAAKIRADLAAPGPWSLWEDGGVGIGTDGVEHPNTGWQALGPVTAGHGGRWKAAQEQAERDAEFIAHARGDVPALADECLRLRAVLGRLEWSCRCSGHTYCPSCRAAECPTTDGKKPGDGEHYPGCELAEFATEARP